MTIIKVFFFGGQHRRAWRLEQERPLLGGASSGGERVGKDRGSSQPSEAAVSLKLKRGIFQKDLQHMMYGFGDDPNPLSETVALVEDIVVEYITDMVHKAQSLGSKRGRFFTHDFLYQIRKDLPELQWCTELKSSSQQGKLLMSTMRLWQILIEVNLLCSPLQVYQNF